MRSFYLFLFVCFVAGVLPTACVDPFDQTLSSTLDVVVVDGTITNLAEPQIIRLNRSKADPLTGRFGTTPITKARVEVVIDSGEVVVFAETETGRYQSPAAFMGKIGHSYRLRFMLNDGTRYLSGSEIMSATPPIKRVYATFNPNSLSSAQQLKGGYAAAHDFYVDVNDPADEHNYYRWEWIDWERQDWCRTCNKGLYYVRDANGNLIEDCVESNLKGGYDYNCRNACWEIIYSRDLSLFDDQYSNGNLIAGRKVAQVPVYSKEHCLIEIRQNSLTPIAYSYFKKLNEQTQNTGGVADTPATIRVGNVHNEANLQEPVIGYFTTSAVASQRYWLTRSDATGFAPGLFQALNDGRNPVNEQSLVRDRPPLAICAPSDTKTPYKPDGWRD